MSHKFDFHGLSDAVNSLASQAVLEGVLHGKDGSPIDTKILAEKKSAIIQHVLAEVSFIMATAIPVEESH